jgi:hypothetical protein
MARMHLARHAPTKLQLFFHKNKRKGKGLGFRVLDYNHDGFRVHQFVWKGRDKRNRNQIV